jgi:pSer/pThr/pTyr-binding forkhead associated (FHA) protein
VGRTEEGAAGIGLLVVREGSAETRSVPLAGDVTIGRDPSCVLRLRSPYVSRVHARVEVSGEQARLVDLGSHNGTLLNGVRVRGQVVVRPGDVIAIADAQIECAVGSCQEETRTLAPVSETGGPSDLLRVDTRTFEVWTGDRHPARRLSAQEFALLRYLYEHRERVCTRRELGDAIWGPDAWDPNMLHRLVHRLKDKLEPSPERPRYIRTLPQIGYRLTP